MQIGLTNVPSKLQKRMDDIFGDLTFAIVYIDSNLICSKDLKEHAKHLGEFYQRIYKHGLVLSTTNMEIGDTKIEFLGLVLSKGRLQLQEHVLKMLQNFLDVLTNKA